MQLLKKPAPYRRWDLPMLVLGAEFDQAVSAGALKGTAKKLGVKAVIIPGIGHDMMLDIGRERVAKEMLYWLDGIS